MQPASLTMRWRVPGGLIISTRFRRPIRVPLGAGKHDNVLVTGMLVERHDAGRAKSQKSRAWSGKPIAIETMDLHARLERLPRDLVLSLSDVEELLKFDARKTGDGREFGIRARVRI